MHPSKSKIVKSLVIIIIIIIIIIIYKTWHS